MSYYLPGALKRRKRRKGKRREEIERLAAKLDRQGHHGPAFYVIQDKSERVDSVTIIAYFSR
jgi:hypothetical protein